MLFLTSFLLALPAQLTKQGNPKLYKKMSGMARANLKLLPAGQAKAYKNLLKAFPDAVMAYLIAYESDAVLASTKPEDIQSNYVATIKLLEKEGLRYDPDFYLSYVADQSASDEPLTPYRKALLEDGLQAVIDTTFTDLDRYRATTLWCVSRLKFQQTSGRDQSPLDITQRSLAGRCEEMQILFVAAARTVGLPARAASTPWWAHMDNNHAWAEVYLDGAWHYTGDMDAAWFPDQTWFSGMIDKTVLILADGSLASVNDEVLVSGRYETLINSTRNYAKERTRTIKVKVLDENGKPASQARLIPMVFNWGSLRPITYLNTNDNGCLQFSVGRGAFFLSAYKDGKRALEYIPSGTDEIVDVSISLGSELFGSGFHSLEYPSNPMHWDNQPESYREMVNREKQLWQEKMDLFADDAMHNTEPDSLAMEVATACRGNLNAYLSFEKKYYPVDDSFLEFLLIHDPKFLWQASAEQFEALYVHYSKFGRQNHDEEAFLSLLSPAVFYEELPEPFIGKTGAIPLYPDSFVLTAKSGREGVLDVLAKLQKKYKIRPEKALSGLLRLDVAVRQKYLSPVQYRILACSALRANGFPAEFSRIPDLVSVYIEDSWQYVNVKQLEWEDMTRDSETKTFKLVLRLTDENKLPLRLGEEQMSLCRYLEGTFYPLNDRFEYLGSGIYEGNFPASECYLQLGYRPNDSKTNFQLLPVWPETGDSLSYDLILHDYPRSWKAADMDILVLLDENTLNERSLILIGSMDQENSRRIAEKLQSLEKDFLWLGYSTGKDAPQNYAVNPGWQKMVQEKTQNALRSITLIKKEGQWQMFEGLWDKLP